MEQQKSVMVTQFFSDEQTTAYRVKQTVNTTDPELDTVLTKADVDQLVAVGMKVTIVRPS